MESKVGNVFLASEAAVRLGGAGVISMVSIPYALLGLRGKNNFDTEQSVHPGLLRTGLQRHLPSVQSWVMVSICFVYHPRLLSVLTSSGL